MPEQSGDDNEILERVLTFQTKNFIAIVTRESCFLVDITDSLESKPTYININGF